MIGASKILTVSYGTFSCTLEGFDEPFNTMKAIAEYFRDLAADDRYFGAEPPTPDAAMLHRIAEREVQRRVEAKIQDNGVILRAGDAQSVPSAPPLPQPSAMPTLAPVVADAVSTTDSVAARLSRLRASRSVVLPTAQEALFDTMSANNYNEDEHADDFLATLATAPEAVVEAEFVQDTSYEVADAPNLIDQDLADKPALMSEAVFETAAIGDEDRIEDDQAAAADDAVLDRMAAEDYATDTDEAPVPAQPVHAQPVHAQPAGLNANDDHQDDDSLLASLGNLMDAAPQPIAEIADPDSDALDDFEAEFEPSDDSDAEFGDFTSVADADDGIVDAEVVTPDLIAVDDQPAEVAAPIVNERQQRARARVIKIRRADVPASEGQAPATSLLSDEAEAALQAELAALEAETDHRAVVETTSDVVEVTSARDAAQTPREVRPVRPVRTIRPTIASDTLPQQITTAPKSDTVADAIATIMAPEAVVETPVLAQVVADVEPTPDAAQEMRERVDAEDGDAAVNRLIAQTNSEMAGPENKRRLSAIAHLKAAVAATVADRIVKRANHERPAPDKIDPYRNDLESVVRPSRTPNGERPSPLVLVSEQRIDRAKPVTMPSAAPSVAPSIAAVAMDPAPRAVMPVRPRRMAGGSAMAMQREDTLLGAADDDFDEDELVAMDAAANLFVDGKSFEDFAERLGATQLPELLEAAAVYCAQVLGQPEFSRPLVMHQLETLPGGAGYSREDSLRVFGTLLRQGRIAKVKRGQFAVTDRSPILAEALRTAG